MFAHYLAHFRHFSREARLFLIAAAVFAFASAVPSVFFNLYLQAMGFDRLFLGAIATASQLGGGGLMALPAAVAIDHIGRKPMLLIGTCLNLGFWAASLLTSSGQLLACQALSGVGHVMYALVAVPLLAEYSTPRERTTLFSTNEGMMTLALFFGGVLCGGLPAALGPLIDAHAESAVAYRAALLVSVAVRLLGLIPLALIHQQPKPPHLSSRAPLLPGTARQAGSKRAVSMSIRACCCACLGACGWRPLPPPHCLLCRVADLSILECVSQGPFPGARFGIGCDSG